MKRNEFIHRLIITWAAEHINPMASDFADQFDTIVDRAETVAMKLQDGGEAPWNTDEGLLEKLDKIADALHILGSAGSPLFCLLDDARDIDTSGLRDTAGTLSAEQRALATLSKKRRAKRKKKKKKAKYQ